MFSKKAKDDPLDFYEFTDASHVADYAQHMSRQDQFSWTAPKVKKGDAPAKTKRKVAQGILGTWLASDASKYASVIQQKPKQQ